MKELLYIDCYGVGVEISCQDNQIIDNLRRDFSYFVVKEKINSDIRVNIVLQVPPYGQIPPLKASMHLPDGVIYDDDKIRYVSYYDGALTIYDRSRNSADIFSENEYLLYEVAYFFIISPVGQMLDKKGMHRLHALGIEYKGLSVVCLLPGGGGKSTLGLELLKYNGIKLLSDDAPLITKTGRILPFPSRMAFKELPEGIPNQFFRKFERRRFGQKFLLDIDYFHLKIGEAVRPRFIFLGERHASPESRIERVPKYKAIVPFVVNGVIGLGLPQMVEYFLSNDMRSILRLIALGAKRLRAAIAHIMKSQTYLMVLGTDTKKNAFTLYNFLKGQNEIHNP